MQGLIPGEGLQSGGGVLHRKVTEKLNSLKELAGRQVERADRIERAGRAQVGSFAGLLKIRMLPGYMRLRFDTSGCGVCLSGCLSVCPSCLYRLAKMGAAV